MKRLIKNTLAMLQGDTKSAIETFVTKSARYNKDEEKLLREIRALVRYYPDADEQTRKYLSMLSSLLYDMVPLGKGRTASLLCFSPAGLAEQVSLNLGTSESIFFALGGVPNKHLVLPADIDDTPDDGVVRYFQEGSHVGCLSREHNIHYYRDICGSLVLLSVLPVDSAVLVDEELFGDEEPLYFTESTHFVSPVYLLDKATILIRQILRRINYPHLRIRHIVVYDGEDCYPINEDDAWESDKQWFGRDLENLVIRRTPDRIPLEGLRKQDYPASLLQVMQVACKHFDRLKQIGPRYMEQDIHEYVKKQVKLT